MWQHHNNHTTFHPTILMLRHCPVIYEAWACSGIRGRGGGAYKKVGLQSRGDRPKQRVVKGGLDHVSRKIKRSFHNSGKINQVFHVSRKKRRTLFALTKVTCRYILKKYVQSKAFLVVVCPLRVLRNAKRKPSSQFCISPLLLEWLTASSKRQNV